jgi:hypothetical protein
MKFLLAAALAGILTGPGDMDLDGMVTGTDVDIFVEELLRDRPDLQGDMTLDGLVDGRDVDPFVDAVLDGVMYNPEPSSLLLSLIGAMGLWWCSRAMGR